MLRSERSFVLLSTMSLGLLAGCSSGGSGVSVKQRTGTMVVSVVPAGDFTLASTINLGSGSLTLQTAVFGIERVEIEESTGEGVEGGEGEEGGEGNEGGEHENGEHENGEHEQEGETGTEEIVLPGPFVIDVASSVVTLGSVAVFPGTFLRAELEFRLDAGVPLAGDSIYIAGTFEPAGGGSIPFRLASRFLGRIEAAIANGGITVIENSVVPLALTFDLAALLGGLDLASAAIEGGEILVDETHNTALLAAFEDGLQSCARLEEDHGEHGEHEHEHEGEEHGNG